MDAVVGLSACMKKETSEQIFFILLKAFSPADSSSLAKLFFSLANLALFADGLRCGVDGLLVYGLGRG